MLGNYHTDLVKYEYLTRSSPRNANSYVMTVVEAAILPNANLFLCQTLVNPNFFSVSNTN